MTPHATARPAISVAPASGRMVDALEWLLTLGLAANLAWTAMCLGGYLAETMVWTSRGTWLLTALGALILVLRPRTLDWRALIPVPFLAFALVSVLWLAPAKWLAWREWLLWLQMWLWFVLGLHFCRTRAQTWTLLGTLLALGLVGAGLAAYQRFVDPKWMMLGLTQAEQFWQRSGGMFGIPNSLAALLEFVLPLCLVWLGSRSVDVTRKIACAWLALVFMFALVLTGSRGGWLATIAALALWPLLTSRDLRRGALLAGSVLLAAALALVALYFFSERARGRIDPFLAGQFESSRPLIWKVGLILWLQAPWFGTGAASYNVLFDQHRPKGFLPEPDWTHNDYLNTLSDYGAVGFVLWAGAGVWLLRLGWLAVRAARREAVPGDPLGGWRGRLALWLGLVAFAIHLGVDFHTKIPALACTAALLTALLVRGTAVAAESPSRSRLVLVLLPVLALVAASAARADGLYRSEALRFEARRDIDRLARGIGRFDLVVPRGMIRFQEAVKVDPANGRAWGDLAYATALSWHVSRGDGRAIGRRAEAAAERALALCAVSAEFWAHQGVARDLQGRTADAEASFHRALQLAPHNAEWHYHLAHHLAPLPDRKAEALAAVAACLDLDPSNPQANALRARLASGR